MTLVGLAGVDDHSNESSLFLDEKDPNFGPDPKSVGEHASAGKRSKELQSNRPLGPESAIPVRPSEALTAMDMFEFFLRQPNEVRLPESCSNGLRGCCRNFSWSYWPVIGEQSKLVPIEADHGARSRLVQVAGSEKLVDGLSV